VPDLKFERVDVLVSVDSLTIYYRAVFGKMAAEVLLFNAGGKLVKSIAHYSQR